MSSDSTFLSSLFHVIMKRLPIQLQFHRWSGLRVKRAVKSFEAGTVMMGSKNKVDLTVTQRVPNVMDSGEIDPSVHNENNTSIVILRGKQEVLSVSHMVNTDDGNTYVASNFNA